MEPTVAFYKVMPVYYQISRLSVYAFGRKFSVKQIGILGKIDYQQPHKGREHIIRERNRSFIY